MEVLLLAVVSLSNIACFLIGAKLGQTVAKGEKIETPAVNSVKVVREHNDRKEAEIAQSKFDTIMRNLENYDGTSYGQEDVPGR